MKMYKLQISEEELIALIAFHSAKMSNNTLSSLLSKTLEREKPSLETAQRITDLTRRLNKETPEIETEVSNKEQPKAQEGW